MDVVDELRFLAALLPPRSDRLDPHEVMTRAADEVERLRDGAGGWRAIETSARVEDEEIWVSDGELVALAFFAKGVWAVGYDDGAPEADYLLRLDFAPTHWQEFVRPEPPAPT